MRLRDGFVAFDTVASDPFFSSGIFNGHTITGSFCLDKFRAFEGNYILHLYGSKDDTTSELKHCQQNVFLNCLCDCEDHIEQKHKLKMRLVKDDDSENGNCCWNITLANPQSSDSAGCDYDLSGLNFILRQGDGEPSIIPGYNLSDIGNGFEFDWSNPQNPHIWHAPQDLVLKTGETVVVGRICSRKIPAGINNHISFHILMAKGILTGTACDTLLSANISCDSIVDCCDTWNLSAYMSRGEYFGNPNGGGGLGGGDVQVHYSACLAEIRLHFLQSMQDCGYDDDIFVQVFDSTNTQKLSSTFKVSELNNFVLGLNWFSFSGQKTFCIAFKNLVTLDSCYKCITLTCPGSSRDILNKESVEDDESLEFINTQDLNVIPNPFESSCEVSFNSQKGLNLEISLNDVMGRSVITQKITTAQGLNTITLNNLDLPSGVYHISVKFPDKVLTKQVMIIK
jgi:hypothetical protein